MSDNILQGRTGTIYTRLSPCPSHPDGFNCTGTLN